MMAKCRGDDGESPQRVLRVLRCCCDSVVFGRATRPRRTKIPPGYLLPLYRDPALLLREAIRDTSIRKPPDVRLPSSQPGPKPVLFNR